MAAEFDPVADYAVVGHTLAALRSITAKLNDPKPLTWDERRDMANRIDLMLAQVVKLT